MMEYSNKISLISSILIFSLSEGIIAIWFLLVSIPTTLMSSANPPVVYIHLLLWNILFLYQYGFCLWHSSLLLNHRFLLGFQSIVLRRFQRMLWLGIFLLILLNCRYCCRRWVGRYCSVRLMFFGIMKGFCFLWVLGKLHLPNIPYHRTLQWFPVLLKS